MVIYVTRATGYIVRTDHLYNHGFTSSSKGQMIISSRICSVKGC